MVRIKEVIIHFGVSESSIRRWEAQGMPSFKVGRIKLYDLAICEDWVRDRGVELRNAQ